MLARIDEDGAVVRQAADAGATVLARPPRGTFVEIGESVGKGAERWVGVTTPDGKRGFVAGTTRIALLREMELRAASADLFDRPGSWGVARRTLRKGARFHVVEVVEEQGEKWVGVRLPSGGSGFVAAKAKMRDVPRAGARAGAFALERGLLGSGRGAGLLLMVAAVAWFVLGWQAGRIFFYPPVLFVVGLVAFLRGVVGARPATEDDLSRAPGESPRAFRPRLLLGIAALAALVGVALVLALPGPSGPKRASQWLLNGLDIPVTTTFDAIQVTIPPRSAVPIEVDLGRHHVLTKTEAGATVEELDVDLPRSGGLTAYNVLGAAPLRVEKVIYAASSEDEDLPEDPPAPVRLAGESWVLRTDVDYVFVDAPEQLRLKRSITVKLRAVVAEGGWRTAVGDLVEISDRARAADLAERVALLQGGEEDLGIALQLASGAGDARLAVFAERVVASLPDSVHARRMHQEALERLGRKEEARATYRARYEKDPGSAQAGYLYARTLPRAEAVPLLETLLAAHPDDSWLRRSMAWHLFGEARFADALPHFERLAALDPAVARARLSDRARALAATGRTADAQRLVRREIGPGRYAESILYAQLERLPAADPSLPKAESLLDELLGGTADGPDGRREAARGTLAMRARDAAAFEAATAEIRDRDYLDAGRIGLLSFSDVAAAADLGDKASEGALAQVDDVARLAVVLELLRTDRGESARRAFGPAGFPGLPVIAPLSSPAEALRGEGIDLSLKAALAVGAARRTSDEAERARLLALARTYDVLREVVPR